MISENSNGTLINNVIYNNSRFDIFFKTSRIYYNSDHDVLKYFRLTNNKIHNNKIINYKSNKTIKLNFRNVQSQVVNQILKMKNNKSYNLVTIRDAIKTMEVINKLR